MKHIGRVFFILAAFLTAAVPAHAFEGADYLLGSSGNGSHKLSLGARYHDEVKSVAGLPFEKEDLSWLLAYEYHEEIAFWQLGLGYAPTSNTDSGAKVMTPQVNLIFKDGIYRLGTGVLQSYVDIDGEKDWTDLYWQVIAGADIPLGANVSIGIYGCYVFHHWDEITETDDNGLAGNLLLSWGF